MNLARIAECQAARDAADRALHEALQIYEINHTTKTVRRIMGAFEEPVIERVVEAAGWKYEDKSVMT
jgi:hypothetical protein